MSEYANSVEVFKKARKLIGLRIEEINGGDVKKDIKGGIGKIVEQYLGCDSSNKPTADLPDIGLEIKTTAAVWCKRRNTYTAYSRLVCGMINFEEEAGKEFKDSSFWTKCKDMLWVIYEHKKKVPKNKLRIIGVSLVRFPSEDMATILKDYQIIQSDIMSGNADKMSESKTEILGACTKRSGKSNYYASQPFSTKKAKKRAYSIKHQYMRYLMENFIFGNMKNKNIKSEIWVGLSA